MLLQMGPGCGLGCSRRRSGESWVFNLCPTTVPYPHRTGHTRHSLKCHTLASHYRTRTVMYTHSTATSTQFTTNKNRGSPRSRREPHFCKLVKSRIWLQMVPGCGLGCCSRRRSGFRSLAIGLQIGGNQGCCCKWSLGAAWGVVRSVAVG